MNKKTFIAFAALLFMFNGLWAQKKPLDHSVYDGWKSISGEKITNNGLYVIYNINPQEGDGNLVITNTQTGNSYTIPRGYMHTISSDQQYAVFKVKPLFADVRKAKIDKKKADEMPVDSLAIVHIGVPLTNKIPHVKSYKMGKDVSEHVAYLSVAPPDTTGGKKPAKKESGQGNPLVIRHLKTNSEDTIKNVVEYAISHNGKFLAATLKPSSKDSVAKAGVVLYDMFKKRIDTLTSGKGDYKLPVFAEDGMQLAFLADRDTAKAEEKDFELYYFKQGMDSARIVADEGMNGMPKKWGVGEHGSLSFSKNGRRLFFGIAPVRPPKDSTIVDFEVATLDIWHWDEPELQTVQLKNRDRYLKYSYTATISLDNLSKIIPIADEKVSHIYMTQERNSNYALGLDDSKYRKEMQWDGFIRDDLYVVSLLDGSKTLIKKGLNGNSMLSTGGKYIAWYDAEKRHWFSYSIDTEKTVCLTDKIDVNFWNEKNDTPNDPSSYGIAGWLKDDKGILLYDMYDIWLIDPEGVTPAQNLTGGEGRKTKVTLRYLHTDPEKRYIEPDGTILLSAFDNTSKMNGLYTVNLKKKGKPVKHVLDGNYYTRPVKAKNANTYVYKKGNFSTFPDLHVTTNTWKTANKLTDACPEMRQYNWGTAELVKWQTEDGIEAEGILYKPEDFDPSKKYPMIVYFYEKSSELLYYYFSPSPSRSIINFPFFASRGYLVFMPDVYFETGHPGKSSYKSIIPGVNELCKNSWVDKDNIGIQGQSWGGYQTAYLITQTNMFKAAGAGAPVSNMTSAYGGIRWESGLPRQFQYEHQQSRIGRTLWDGLDLYIENSPLFFADKIETPVLIMHNDNDGAVPWYQGIEFFTALRRLGKPAWMLQYNREAHNLMERRNCKDLSIRLQQFFDHYLKGDKMPKWMKDGVPATEKGRTWGYELVD